MATLAVLAFALLAGSTEATFRIVGGRPTTVNRYPSIVQVEYYIVDVGIWAQYCGANILTRTFVLSAAHCFTGTFYRPYNRRIRAGTSYSSRGGVISRVDREFNHPSYGTPGRGSDGDINVVKLMDPLVYTPVIQAGIILAQGMQVPDNLPVVHAGWGAIFEGGPPHHELMEVSIFTVNHELCVARYASIGLLVTENMICAGLLDIGGADACQGDSGGPLYFVDETLGDILVGVVSWGEGCGNATFPGVSTAVSSYTNWIEHVVKYF